MEASSVTLVAFLPPQVKSVKYLLLKSDNYSDFEKKLYEMQKVPSSWGTLSPAEKKKSPILNAYANFRSFF
jgi:hypothetical protein